LLHYPATSAAAVGAAVGAGAGVAIGPVVLQRLQKHPNAGAGAGAVFGAGAGAAPGETRQRRERHAREDVSDRESDTPEKTSTDTPATRHAMTTLRHDDTVNLPINLV